MPHLQFEINKKLKKNCKQKFIAFIEESFSKIMQTGTDHIAITLRELEKENISLGRVNEKDAICLMNLDIRSGRSKKQKIEVIQQVSKKSNLASIKNKYDESGVIYKFIEFI